MTGDRFNPIFLYEIRRFVRNRTILTALCLYMIAQTGVLASVLHEMLTSYSFADKAEFGKSLAYYSLLLLFCSVNGLLMFYSASTTVRQSFEELFHLIPMTYRQVARGKIAVGAVFSALFFAVTLPFLTVAWMLRGIDLQVLLLLLVLFFCAIQPLHLFVTAAFIRCKKVGDVSEALIGLLLGALPLFGSTIFIPMGICWTALFGSELYAHEIVVYLICLILGLLLSMILFREVWNIKSVGERCLHVTAGCYAIVFFVFFSVVPLTWLLIP